MNKYTKQDLKAFQGEPLNIKVMRTTAKIAEWYSHFNNQVYVSFSGGKDSTVLADLCARYCRVIDAPLYLAFVNTGLEYPEIQQHVRFFADWLREKYGIEVVLDILKPSMRFDDVIRKYGYPVISKEVSNKIYEVRRNPDSKCASRFEENSEYVKNTEIVFPCLNGIHCSKQTYKYQTCVVML